jgi:hypothetical protein
VPDRSLKTPAQTLTRPQKYFRTPELAAKTENTDISLYSATRIDKMVNIFITFVIFILLVIPISE